MLRGALQVAYFENDIFLLFTGIKEKEIKLERSPNWIAIFRRTEPHGNRKWKKRPYIIQGGDF